MDEDGYLFAFECVDMNLMGNAFNGQLLLIATTRGEAVECARDFLPTANQLTMIDSGAELLLKAKRLGLTMHEAKII